MATSSTPPIRKLFRGHACRLWLRELLGNDCRQLVDLLRCEALVLHELIQFIVGVGPFVGSDGVRFVLQKSLEFVDRLGALELNSLSLNSFDSDLLPSFAIATLNLQVVVDRPFFW